MEWEAGAAYVRELNPQRPWQEVNRQFLQLIIRKLLYKLLLRNMKVEREELKVAPSGEQELWMGREVQGTAYFHNNLCYFRKK